MREQQNTSTTLSTIIEQLKDTLLSYIQLRLRLLRLEFMEQSSRLLASAIYGMAILFTCFLASVLLLISIATIVYSFTDSILLSILSAWCIIGIVLAIGIYNKHRIYKRLINTILRRINKNKN